MLRIRIIEAHNAPPSGFETKVPISGRISLLRPVRREIDDVQLLLRPLQEHER